MKTASIMIGNSDDKLGQREWSQFVADTDREIVRLANNIFFSGFAAPSAQWQNACWVVEVADEQDLKQILARLAKEYRQDSIALVVGDSELVKP